MGLLNAGLIHGVLACSFLWSKNMVIDLCFKLQTHKPKKRVVFVGLLC